jgi:hypothetical protein
LGKAWVQGGTSNKINQNKATRKYNNNKHMNTKMNKVIYENNKIKDQQETLPSPMPLCVECSRPKREQKSI